MNRVVFVVRQHEEIDPVTGSRRVQLDRFDVVKIDDLGFEEKMNDQPLKERAAERLRRRLYASVDTT